MIHLTSAGLSDAAAAPGTGEQPALPGLVTTLPASIGGKVSPANVSGFVDQLAATLAQAVALSPEDPAAETAREVRGDADEPSAETVEASVSPEQWLLGVQDQQRLVIAARDGGQANGRQAQQGTVTPSVSSAMLDADLLAKAAEASALAPRQLSETLHGVVAAQASAVHSTAALNGDVADLLGMPGERAGGSVQQGSLAAGVGTETAQRTQAPFGEQFIRLQSPEAKWGEQMLYALRNHVELQLQHHVQHATIRLDPPDLGSLDLHLSHEAGRLSVQITAAHSDVARLLQQTSDRLRQELVGQNFLQVDVQVFSDGQQGRQGHAHQRQPHSADEMPVVAAVTDGDSGHANGRKRDVLVTV